MCGVTVQADQKLIELNYNLCFSDIKFDSDVRGSSAGGSEANKEGSDKSRLVKSHQINFV